MATQFSSAPCEFPVYDDSLYALDYINDKYLFNDKLADEFVNSFESFNDFAFENLQFHRSEPKPLVPEPSLTEVINYEQKAAVPKVQSKKRRKQAGAKSNSDTEDRTSELSVRNEAINKRRTKSFTEGTPDDAMSVGSRKCKRPRSNSDSDFSYDSSKSLRAPLWSEDEEIFLVGAVMARFFKYGSLASARKTDNDVWESIKENFDNAVAKHGKPGQTPRSKNALSRHYKFMKSNTQPRFYELWKLWEKKYGSLL